MWLLFLSGILTVAGFFGRFGWLFDLTSYFHPSYFLIQLICVIFFAIVRQRKAFLAALLLGGINAVLIVPYCIPLSGRIQLSQGIAETVRVVTINVNTENKGYKDLFNYVCRFKPDILALDEIDKTWFDFLTQHLNGYRFARYAHCGECDGIGIFSKNVPLEDKVCYFSPLNIPAVILVFDNGANNFKVMFSHSICPTTQDHFYRRNLHLKELASYIHNCAGNFIFIGDLNTGPWSYYYNMFLRFSGLRDTRSGFGIAPTWRANFFLSAMIDQCLVKGGCVVVNYKVGGGIGSDHYPLYCEVGIRRV